MKSILLLSVCAYALTTSFGRVPVSQRDQKVLKNLAAIKVAITKIESCLPVDTFMESSDAYLPTDAEASASEADSDDPSSSCRPIIKRAKGKPPKQKVKKISYGTNSDEVIVKKDRYLNSSLVASQNESMQTSEPEPQINSTDIDRLVHSVYSKAIEEIKAFSSIELSDDDDSLPQLGKLSLRIQIILDPAQVINDELAAQSLQVGQSAASRKLLATAIEKNKASIDEYSELKKIKKVKSYFKHLERLKSVLMAKAKGILAEFLQSKNTDDGYELISSGATLINSFSLQLAKNGVFRQYFIDKEGKPTLFDSAVPIEADSSQDNAVTHIIDLLSAMALHQLDINTLEIVFNNDIIKKGSINMDNPAQNIYIVNKTHIEVAQFQEDESSFAVGKQKNPPHQLTGPEIRSLQTVVTTLIKQALRNLKLRSSAYHPLLTAIHLKPDFEISESE